jgi:guanine deaminase
MGHFFVIRDVCVVQPQTLNDVRLLEHHAVGVDGTTGRIAFVCRAADAAAHASAHVGATAAAAADVQWIDGGGKLLVPGLVDTHCHAPQYRNAGLGTDRTLLQWLETYTFPTEARFADMAFARDVYSKVVRRTLRNGTTTCCYFATLHADATLELARVVQALGQRALVGKVCMDRNAPASYVEPSAAASLADTVRVLDQIEAMACPTVHAVLTPRFVPTCSSELMHGLGALARDRRVFVQSHISENVDEVQWVRELHPDCDSYADVYFRHGLLNDRSVMAHAVHLTDAELALFQRTGAAVSHCANSNFTICSGVLDVRRVLAAGVKVGLGTDVSGGFAPSMWDAIRHAIAASAAVLASDRRADRHALSYTEAFYLATLGGAHALGLGDQIGSLEPGKQFDALLIDPAAPGGPIDVFDGLTAAELFSKVVFLCDDRNIESVWVNGRKLQLGLSQR